MPSGPQNDPAIVDSTAALASLYQAPLADFVPRRTALVTQLKRSGHKEVAARLASAAKPSRAAFLVNQVFWRARPLYDAVLEAGTAARAAQQARLLGDTASDLGDTLRARDEAVRAALAQAERVAADDGQPVSDAIRGQVRASFEALAAHGLEGRLPHGHLTADVELPGLAALAGLVLSTSAPGPVRRFEVVARRREPDAPTELEPPPPDPRVVELETRLEALAQQEQDAAERLSGLEAGVAAATDVLAAAKAAADEASRQLVAARQAVTRGEQARDAARVDADRITRERQEAEQSLRALRGGATGSNDDGPAPTMPTPRPRKGGPPTKEPRAGGRAPAPRRPRR